MSRTREARAGAQERQDPGLRWAPAQQRITIACQTRVNALMVLRCVGGTSGYAGSFFASPNASASSEYDFFRASWSYTAVITISSSGLLA